MGKEDEELVRVWWWVHGMTTERFLYYQLLLDDLSTPGKQLAFVDASTPGKQAATRRRCLSSRSSPFPLTSRPIDACQTSVRVPRSGSSRQEAVPAALI